MIIFFLLALFSFETYAQKGNVKDVIVRACTQNLGNGLYRVQFGYDNPNNNDVTYNDDDSYVKFGNSGKRVKGPKVFKKGSVDDAFSLVINEREVVEWTVINSKGKVNVVTASANSSHCTNTNNGPITPVYGQGLGKEDRSSLIGLDLTALAEDNAGDTPSEIIFQISDSQKVLIEIVPVEGNLQAVINLMTSTYGLTYSTNSAITDFLIAPAQIISNNFSTVDIFFPIDKLLELNQYPGIINFVRPLQPSFKNSGIVTSQGDSALKSDIVRSSFKTSYNGTSSTVVDGSGIKIGVISDSYDAQPFTGVSKATVDVQNGDLPGSNNPNGYTTPVQVISDYPSVASDEGRAMLQIIHDVAPGAGLAFHTGTQSPRVFEIGLKALQNANCDIIVDDLTFLTEPFFGSGRINVAIKEFTSQSGKAYFTSAGNFSNRGYQSIFQISTSNFPNNFLDPIAQNKFHKFGTNANGSNDILQKIQVVAGTYMLVLQWDEGYASQQNSTGAATDLDIYLVDDSGNLLVGNNRFNDARDPTEVLVFQASAPGVANILINNVNTSNTNLSFRYIAFIYNGFEFVEYNSGAPTVSGHALTPEAITIGAVDYRNAQNPVVEPFSSVGGLLPNQFNAEIDFVAPDGGNTNVASVGQDTSADSDNFPNFYGTSAAAPHAAAATALLLSAVPSWYPSGLPIQATIKTNVSVDKALELFKLSAIPAGLPQVAGAGFIDAEATFKRIASQTPQIASINFELGKVPSAEPFLLTIEGEFLSDDTTVFFNGEEVDIISRNGSEIVVKIEEFTGNPDLQLYTPPKTVGQTDGGLGDAVKLLDEGKIALKITADDKTVEFGQSISFTYTIEGLPENTTFESLLLPELKFSSPAVLALPYPDVNSYVVTPYFDPELSQEQKDLYQINFKNGLLEISKKDLTIRPKDATFTYGTAIVLDLDYIYNSEGVEDNVQFLNAIKNAHEADFFPENTLAMVNKYRAVINDYNIDILELLNNGSWIASERTINNRFRAVANGMRIVDLDGQNFKDYVDASNDATTNAFRAILNKFRAIANGQDLFSNNVEVSIANSFRPVLNTSGLGGDNDQNDYSSVFAIIDAEDVSTDTEERTISKLYALNLITGLNANQTPDEYHYIFPGAFIAPIAANFNINYTYGRLKVNKANLPATIGDVIINQGDPIDVNLIVSEFIGFVYDDNKESVFPDGISYTFINSQGVEYTQGDSGVFDIRIKDPLDYTISYATSAKLLVNLVSNGIKKVRTYLDCVEYHPNSTDGLIYTANFRYNNPNANTIFVSPGLDNKLTGPALFDGILPTIFLSGEGTFQIRFDGNQLVWSLTTYESTHKTAVSSSATADSGRCDAKDNGNTSQQYVLFPNPANTTLNIKQEIPEAADIEIYNSYGILFKKGKFDGSGNQKQFNLSGMPSGLLIVRISNQNATDLKIFYIIKE